MKYTEYLFNNELKDKITDLINNGEIMKKYTKKKCILLTENGKYIVENNKYKKIQEIIIKSNIINDFNIPIYQNIIEEIIINETCIPIIHSKLYFDINIYKFKKHNIEICIEKYLNDNIEDKIYLISKQNNSNNNKNKKIYNKMRDNFDAKRISKIQYNDLSIFNEIINS
jgi:hypothetical protein